MAHAWLAIPETNGDMKRSSLSPWKGFCGLIDGRCASGNYRYREPQIHFKASCKPKICIVSVSYFISTGNKR
jgi:hypothetical protein